jgi:hypothetical protein
LTLVSVGFEMMSQQFLSWSNCGCGWKSCTSKILMKRLGRPFFFCYLLCTQGKGVYVSPQDTFSDTTESFLWGIPKHCFCVGVGCAGGPQFDDHKIVPELNPNHSPICRQGNQRNHFLGPARV